MKWDWLLVVRNLRKRLSAAESEEAEMSRERIADLIMQREDAMRETMGVRRLTAEVQERASAAEQEASLLRMAISGVDEQVEAAALANAKDAPWFRVVLVMLARARREWMADARGAADDRKLNQAVGGERALEEFQRALVKAVADATKKAAT